MKLVIVATLVVVLTNYFVLRMAMRLSTWNQHKRDGWTFGLAETLRLTLFFITAHVIWEINKKPLDVVAFIFLAAIIQMTLQIYLHSRGKV